MWLIVSDSRCNACSHVFIRFNFLGGFQSYKTPAHSIDHLTRLSLFKFTSFVLVDTILGVHSHIVYDPRHL